MAKDPLIWSDLMEFLQDSEEEVLEERSHDDGYLEGDEQVAEAYEMRLFRIRHLTERFRREFV